MRIRARRWLPPLFHQHPGYFRVVLGLLWLHGWAALDELLPHRTLRHQIPIFNVYNAILPGLGWGFVHAALFAMIAAGVWQTRNNMVCLRIACGLSMTVFLVLCASFLTAAIQAWPVAAFLGVGTAGCIAITSYAAVNEPASNPDSERQPRHVRTQ